MTTPPSSTPPRSEIGPPIDGDAAPLAISGAIGLLPCLAAAALALATPAAAQVVPVDEIRIDYVRPVGLPPIEDPRATAAAIAAALDAYRAACPDDPAGLLAPLPLARLGPFAAIAPEGDPSRRMLSAAAIPASFEGAYGSVAAALAARARAVLAEMPEASGEDPQVAAVRRFLLAAEEIRAAAVPLEQPAMLVGYEVDDRGIAIFDERAAARRPLPSILALGGIEAASLPALAMEIESALEQVLVFEGRDGATIGFDLAVDAVAASRDGRGVLEIAIAFVGPQGAPAVPVSAFEIDYLGGDGRPIWELSEAPVWSERSLREYDLPDRDAVLAATTVRLHRAMGPDGPYLTDFLPGADPRDAEEIRLDLPLPPGERISIGGLQSVMEAILATLQSPRAVEGGGLMGVYVDAADGQLDMGRGGVEIAERPDGVFRIKVVPGIVGDVRALAAGERVDPEERVDPAIRRFDRVKARSPFQPDDPTRQVLRSRTLSDYLDRASRQPNRRVDAAVTPPPPAEAGSEAAAATLGLDYVVTESKPWTAFVQASNTGTEETGEWVTRVGFLHSDLLGNDEILAVEYFTNNVGESNFVNAYFDAPVGDSERFRWKILGGWYQYTASDVGFLRARFEGESPFAAAELSANVFQSGKFFLDLVGGFNWTYVDVYNGITRQSGTENFFIPYVGLRAQRNARDANTDLAVFLDLGFGASESQAELNRLGRLFPDQDFQLLRWNLAQSFYLDPLFHTAESLPEATLAHELYFRFGGQYAFDNRLVPQFMGVAGGLYTVRGYPQSEVSGDNLYLATAEYRLHLPQLFGIDPKPEPMMGIGDPFRLRPQYAYGPTDWDLVVRGFVDFGYTSNSRPLSYEFNSTLIGVGVGVQLQLLRNLDLRLDWGFPLRDVEGTTIPSSQLYFVGTLSF